MSRCYHQYMLKMISPLGLNMTGLAIIMGLYSDSGMSLNEFSKAKRINKALLSKVLQSLQAAGFVKSIPDPNHKQRLQFFLTEKAIELVPQLRKSLVAYEKTVLGDLSPEESHQFLCLLERVYDSL